MALSRPALVCLALAATLLTGCSQPDPIGQPTFLCTPSDGSTPYSCYQVQYEEKLKEDRLYAEAETVYRKFLGEDERIYRAGGVTEPTPVMLESLTGEGLKQATDTYRGLKADGTVITQGAFKLVFLRRATKEVKNDSVATLESCIDGTSIVFREGKTTYAGNISLERAYFSNTDGGLKISSFMSFEGTVSSCE